MRRPTPLENGSSRATVGEEAELTIPSKGSLGRLYFLLFRDVLHRLGWRFPMLIVWTAVVGLGEGLSVILLLPIINKLGISSGGVQGRSVMLLERALADLGARTPVEILAVILAIVAIQSALSVALIWWSSFTARRYQSERQLELFRAIMRAQWMFLAGRKAGELTSAIVTEAERLGGALSICLSLLGSAVITTVYVILSLFIAWQITLCLAFFAVAIALSMFPLYKRSYSAGQSLAPLNAELQSVLAEHFAAAKFVKVTNGLDRASAAVGRHVKMLERSNAVANALPGTVRNLLEFMAFGAVAVLLVAGSGWLGVAAGNVIIVLALFGRLFPRISTLQAQFHHLNWNAPALEAIDGLQKAAEAAVERSSPAPDQAKIVPAGSIVMQDVHVEADGRTLLNGVDLSMSVPGLVAVIGRSGAGKSTLIHTLLGLFEPSAGSMSIGGRDFHATSLEAWRGAIGYVPQENLLFHASIRDNIALLKPDAPELEVQTAARRAHAHEFIMACPDGYDTIIGDQGAKLSGGQRQRISIARALITNPAILLMDEPMSALDAESEQELMRTIDDLRNQMGILIVAHRLAIVSEADRIYVIEAGRIVDSGTWSELNSTSSYFAGVIEASTPQPRVSTVGR